MPKQRTTIAIDGAVASGKTEVGRRLSQHLGYRFLDTGILYRAITWVVLTKGVNLKDTKALVDLAYSVDVQLADPDGTQGLTTNEQRVLVSGEDITAELRSVAVEGAVSIVARVPELRAIMVDKQRALIVGGGSVVVGRDIGTHVAPDADHKIYLVASIEERTKRRYLEFRSGGDARSYSSILGDIVRRDQLDSEREVAPLRPATDAHIVNTENLSLGQVVGQIMQIMESHE